MVLGAAGKTASTTASAEKDKALMEPLGEVARAVEENEAAGLEDPLSSPQVRRASRSPSQEGAGGRSGGFSPAFSRASILAMIRWEFDFLRRTATYLSTPMKSK